MTRDELREEIADIVRAHCGREPDECEAAAEAILAIPEIAQALSLVVIGSRE